MAIATGQITLIDLNDEISLQGFLTSSQPKIQFCNNSGTGQVPSWTGSTKPVITAELYKMGDATNIIANKVKVPTIIWKEKLSGAADFTDIASSNSNYTISEDSTQLTINVNRMTKTAPSLSIRCEVRYKHNEAFPESKYLLDLEYSLSVQGNTGNTGAAAVTAVLSNESHSIPTNKDGGSPVLGGAATTMSVFVGASDTSSSWTFTQGTPSGMTGTASNSNRTFTVTGISADSAYIDITATRSGYSSVTKRFTVTRNKQGITGNTGASATSYWLVSSVSAIGKNRSNVYTPTNFTITAKSQTGTGAPGNYSGRFKITEYNGSTATVKYTSSANEATKTYTPSASTGITSIKVEMYLADGTTTLLDEITIPIVLDGANAVTPIIAYAWAPDGVNFKNADPNATLTADMVMMEGTTERTGTYEWYYQTPGTVDAGAGTGWTKCGAAFAGYNTRKVTIKSSQVDSVESLKCKAVYGGKTFYDTVTFIDQHDPYQIELISTAGTVFKNGVGSTNVTCKLYQNGAEIDNGGTGYNYSWTKYDQNGNQDVNFGGTGIAAKTGKTITITAAQVDEKANFICEVSKK